MSNKKRNNTGQRGAFHGQGARGGRQTSSGSVYPEMNQPPPDFFRGNASHIRPGLLPPPPLFAPSNPAPANPVPYQINLNIIAPTHEKPQTYSPVYLPQNTIAYNPNPVQSSQNYNYTAGNYKQPRDTIDHNDTPPPYTPYPSDPSPQAQPPPPPHLHGKKSMESGGSQQNAQGNGLRSRMKGSQSCNNLDRRTNHFDVTDRKEKSKMSRPTDRDAQTSRTHRKQSCNIDDQFYTDGNNGKNDDSSQESSSKANFNQRRAFNKRGRGDGGGSSNWRGRKGSHDDYNRSRGDRSTVKKEPHEESAQGVYKKGNDFPGKHNREQTKPHTKRPVQDLRVRLNFRTCFDSAAILKSHIQSALVLSENTEFKISFDEIMLMHKKNEAFCIMTISYHDMDKAKACVEELVVALISRLKSLVEYHRVFPETGSSESGCISNRKPGPPKDTKIESTSSAPPIPTNISFKVEKSFSSPKAFECFVESTTLGKPFDYRIVKSSISLSSDYSQCLIETKSKAAARKLTQFFSELQKEMPYKIDAHFEENNKKAEGRKTGQSQSINTKRDAFQKNLEKIKNTIMTSKSQLLLRHSEKILQLKNEVMKKSNSEADEDKLSEAMKQEEVFLTYYNTLYKLLENLDPSTSKVEDITRLQHLFEGECNRLTQGLSIYTYRDDIISKIRSKQVTVIEGEKGCGKSTQIVQYLFNAGYASDGIIVCTHPEQLVTSTLAERVAMEMAGKVGFVVGYKTNVDIKAKSNTKILFAEDLVLLNECLEDRHFKKYSCIVIDEADSRSLCTELPPFFVVVVVAVFVVAVVAVVEK